MFSLSFGTANIGTKNKSAKLFNKILHFFLFLDPNVGTLSFLLEVRIDSLPLCYRRNDAEVDDLVTHNLEVCVRCIESSDLLL